MAKRFTDTDKWKRPWFNDLELKAKVFWIYILDNCDSRGVWFGNFKLASFQVGFKVTETLFLKWFGDKVQRIDDDKFFVRSFIDFQYGELQENNNAHKSVIKLLEDLKNSEHLAPSQDLPSPSGGAHRRAQDKDKDKDKGIKGDFDFESIYAAYPRKIGKGEGLKRLHSFNLSESECEDLGRAVRFYSAEMKRLRTDEKYIKHFDSWVGTKDKQVWRDFIPEAKPTPAPVIVDTTSGGYAPLNDPRPEDAAERSRMAAELRSRMSFIGKPTGVA